MTVYFQDDVSTGKVNNHNSRGNRVKNATQSNSNLEPEKKANSSGIEFK